MTKVDVLLGLQWGDEGKGKIVDVFTPKYDIIARFQGGPNAGHTLEFNGQKHVLHTIPSGIFHPETINIIGNGVIIDAYILLKELTKLREKGAVPEKNLFISKKAHLILPSHRLLDAVYEFSKGDNKIGSTLKGIGPTYTDKVARNGLRIGDTLSPDFLQKYEAAKEKHFNIIKTYNVSSDLLKIEGMEFSEYEKLWLDAIQQIQVISFIDSEIYINKAMKSDKTILAEGAQGTLLDIDFGSYPFVTSSNTITAAVCTGLGIAPQSVGKVFGVFKAYCTRVGSGPFPTELNCETGEKLRKVGREYGSTTGRPRRCGWMDLPALNYSIMINGVTDLIITKADVMDEFEEIKICTHYEFKGEKLDFVPFEISQMDLIPVYEKMKGWQTSLPELKNIETLPIEFKNYLQYIENQTKTPITVISLGPDREQTIDLSL
jgi:adenylosuccinate synthase